VATRVLPTPLDIPATISRGVIALHLA
jgi:hypothetical protein